HRHRRLRQHADARRDDLELALAEQVGRQHRLALPGEQHVADAALDEGDGGAARTGVEDRHLAVEAGDEVARPCLPAVAPEREAPRGEIVPARAARGLGVGGDDLHPRPHQVRPVMDALRVALAHQEDDGRGVGGAGAWQAALPGGGPQAGGGDGSDVVGQVEGDDGALEAVDDRARLLAGAAVRLLDSHLLAGPRLPGTGERGAEAVVELGRRIVGDVEQLDLLRRGGGGAAAGAAGAAGKPQDRGENGGAAGHAAASGERTISTGTSDSRTSLAMSPPRSMRCLPPRGSGAPSTSRSWRPSARSSTICSRGAPKRVRVLAATPSRARRRAKETSALPGSPMATQISTRSMAWAGPARVSSRW